MEVFLNESTMKTVVVIALILLLLFSAFYKEKFLVSGSEKEMLKRLENKTKNRLSGSVVVAIIGLLFIALSLLLTYLFYYKK